MLSFACKLFLLQAVRATFSVMCLEDLQSLWTEQYIQVDADCWKWGLNPDSLCYVIISWQVSVYPVILSLENHCSQEQQEIMAQYLISILGDKLLRTPLDHASTGDLPSPNVRLRKVRARPSGQQIRSSRRAAGVDRGMSVYVCINPCCPS